MNASASSGLELAWINIWHFGRNYFLSSLQRSLKEKGKGSILACCLKFDLFLLKQVSGGVNPILVNFIDLQQRYNELASL